MPALDVSPSAGLTEAEARRRRNAHGPNVLPRPPRIPGWRRLLDQLTHFFAVMLWIAGVLAFMAGLPQLGVAIVVVVLVNAVFAYVEEHRADRAAEGLRELLPRQVTVVRDGRRRQVDAADLVPGDLVVLAAGDRISADLVATTAHALAVDTSTLTGESVPTHVEAGEPLYAGTFVTEGDAEALVTATAADTRLAQIATLTQAGPRPPSPLTRELHRVVRTIATIAVGVGVAFFAVSLLVGTAPSEAVVFAIGVTVALVPEGLLPTVTLSLAIGAQRMARRNALVRRLDAVETLGSTTCVCTDKTGTLTRNEMQVVDVWTPAGAARIRGTGYAPTGVVDADEGTMPALRRLAETSVLCSGGRVVRRADRWVAEGDPMEAALDAFAQRLEVAVDRAGAPTGRFPFDPRRRRMSVHTDGVLHVKGAPDAVLPRCTDAGDARTTIGHFAERGLRVLAVARRRWNGTQDATADEAERDLELLGLVGLEDPPRPAAAAAIADCRAAGVMVAMITGDHPATALAIAREVGLVGDDGRVLTSADLPTDDEHLGAVVDRDGIVVARVTPEDKLRIATALQHRGHVVAMTGDGVNDGPALHAADIGVAMGRSGTDVAREAADLVLLDDDFATIVAAIEYGRATFANIRRFLTYHLSDNVAELTPFLVWALSGGRFPLALGVLQVLALDIGTDTLSAVALGAEPPTPGILRSAPASGRLLDSRVARRSFGLLGPTEAALGMLAFLATLTAVGWRPGLPFPAGPVLLTASGATFATVVIGQTANAFACRSDSRWVGALDWRSNRLLIVAVLIELAVTGLFLFLPVAGDALGHAPPAVSGWTVAALAAPAVIAVDALDKWRRRRRGRDDAGAATDGRRRGITGGARSSTVQPS
ncbi:MAG TPA: cation-transporting P-type ATPase [Euzebyales bacterium]